MNKVTGIIAVVIIILAVGALYVYYNGNSHASTTVSTTVLSTTSLLPTTTIANTSTAASTTTIVQQQVQNRTLTLGQVISSLGTGWFSAAQNNYGTSNVTYPNGTVVQVQGWGLANFTNGGQFLTAQWVQFSNAEQAASYVNSSFSSYFTTNPNTTNGMQGNASYIFYGGDAINNGQAASVMYAYDGPYAILMFNHGTTFPIGTGQQLLGAQLTDLNVT